MIVDCISDLHGYYPELEGGDLLIVAGDLTSKDTPDQHIDFVLWISKQKYKKKVWIAGNHDNFLLNTNFVSIKDFGLEYLCDSGTEFEGLKVWGSPWTKTFTGMNPHCKAFTCDTEEELAEKWKLIPNDVDILVTHGPPNGILDAVQNMMTGKIDLVGSKSLRRLMGKVKPKIWVFGHIHEGYGEFQDTTLSGNEYHFINCSHVNEHYQPVNKPIRVII